MYSMTLTSLQHLSSVTQHITPVNIKGFHGRAILLQEENVKRELKGA